jgi:hypothetical protein
LKITQNGNFREESLESKNSKQYRRSSLILTNAFIVSLFAINEMSQETILEIEDVAAYNQSEVGFDPSEYLDNSGENW